MEQTQDNGASQKRTAAIILNWNGLRHTKQCCESLARQKNAALDIFAVDNGSTKNTAAELRDACASAFAGAETIASETNLGFAGGVNFALRHIMDSGREYDYFWLLNNDTICGASALEEHLAAIQRDDKIAVIGCEMIQAGGKRDGQTIPAGNRMRPPLFIPRTAPAARGGIDYICGASFFMRAAALRDVGLLDGRFFFFFEDADWCFSAVKKGWKIGVTDSPVVSHAGSATIGALSFEKSKYYRAGHVVFLRKHAAHPLPASLFAALYRIAIDALRFNMKAVRGTITGFISGWRQPLPENK